MSVKVNKWHAWEKIGKDRYLRVGSDSEGDTVWKQFAERGSNGRWNWESGPEYHEDGPTTEGTAESLVKAKLAAVKASTSNQQRTETMSVSQNVRSRIGSLDLKRRSQQLVSTERRRLVGASVGGTLGGLIVGWIMGKKST